jgi:hypothetical protein
MIQPREGEMGGTCRRHERNGNRVFVRKHEEERPLPKNIDMVMG